MVTLFHRGIRIIQITEMAHRDFSFKLNNIWYAGIHSMITITVYYNMKSPRSTRLFKVLNLFISNVTLFLSKYRTSKLVICRRCWKKSTVVCLEILSCTSHSCILLSPATSNKYQKSSLDILILTKYSPLIVLFKEYSMEI